MPRYILIVDDDVMVGRTVAKSLRGIGYDLHVATGPASALGIVYREVTAPAVLITDVHMGTGDGRTLAAQLRQLFPGLPVVLISGGFVSPDEPTVQGRGAQRFVGKPFRSEVIRNVVNEVIAELGREP